MSIFEVDQSGLISVSVNDLKTEFETAYKNALGADLNTDTATPQGQLIQNDVKVLNYAQTELGKMANSLSLFQATGSALNTVAGFWGYHRKQGTKTVVTCEVTGTAGTVIPAGSLVSDGGSTEFVSLDTITIGSNGTAEGEFRAVSGGAVPCNAGTISDIITQISGWDTVANSTPGVTGYDTETDNAFRKRITANRLNIMSTSIMGGIVDSLSQLSGVVSAVGRENPRKVQAVVDGVTMDPNSIYVCVYGGENSEIAKVLSEKKTVGAATVGDTEVSFYDELSDYTYTYKIRRPDVVTIKTEITYSVTPYTPAGVEDEIRNLIVSHVSGNPFMIGEVISGNRLAEILAGFQAINLLSFKVAKVTDSVYSDYISSAIWEIPLLDTDNINFVKV